MQHPPVGGTGYQDPLIAIHEGTLVIRRYYFPAGASASGWPRSPGSRSTP
jgi:hypothetical protein